MRLAGTVVMVQMPSVWNENTTIVYTDYSVQKHTIRLAGTQVMVQMPSVWNGNTTAVYINTPYR
jgi:hypothetical protein